MTAAERPAGPAPPVTRTTKLWYGLGQLAEGLKNESFSLFLLFYYTQVVGLSGALAGQAILVSLLFDAVTDPLVGVLSDRLHSRWGRRHPFLYASALPVAVSFYLVFVPPPGLSQAGLFAWLTAFTVLCRIAITLFYVPHMALGAELSSDYEERTRIVMTRYYFARGGQAAAGALGLLVFMRSTPEFERGQLNPAAYPPLTGLGFWTRVAERLDKKTVFVQGLAIYTLFLSGPTFLKLAGWWPAWDSPAYLPTFVSGPDV